MKFAAIILAIAVLMMIGTGCDNSQAVYKEPSAGAYGTKTTVEKKENAVEEHFTKSTTIDDVVHDPVFSSYGRLLFPVQDGYWSGRTL